MKGDISTRLIFVRTPAHVNAHLLICLIALIIMRTIQKRIVDTGLVQTDSSAYWCSGLNASRIQTALNKWKVDTLPDDLCRFKDVEDPDLKLILDVSTSVSLINSTAGQSSNPLKQASRFSYKFLYVGIFPQILFPALFRCYRKTGAPLGSGFLFQVANSDYSTNQNIMQEKILAFLPVFSIGVKHG